MKGQWQYKRVLGLSIFSDCPCAFKLKNKKKQHMYIYIYIVCDRLCRSVVKTNLFYIGLTWGVIWASGGHLGSILRHWEIIGTQCRRPWA